MSESTKQPKNTDISDEVLLDILMDTNEYKPMTADKIIEEFRKRYYEKTGQEKTLGKSTIQRKIQSWNISGHYAIESSAARNNPGYFMIKAPLESPEVIMISQALFRAQNLNKKKAVKLLGKLRNYTNLTGREHIDLTIRQIQQANMRLKTGRNDVFYNIADLLEAIRLKKQVSFYCYESDLTENVKDFTFIKDENIGEKKRFTVSPYYVVAEGNECWLICNLPERTANDDGVIKPMLSHFKVALLADIRRVDDNENAYISIGNMIEFPRYVAICTNPAGSKWMQSDENKKRRANGLKPIMHIDEQLQEFVLDRYIRENLYMFHNDLPPVAITLYFREADVFEVMARFALDRDRINPVKLTAVFSDDEQVFSTKVIAQPNDGLYMWLMQHCDRILIKEPKFVREELKRRLSVALKGIESLEGVEEESAMKSNVEKMMDIRRRYMQMIEFG